MDRLKQTAAWVRDRSAWLVVAGFAAFAVPWCASLAGTFDAVFALPFFASSIVLVLAVVVAVSAPPPWRQLPRMIGGTSAWGLGSGALLAILGGREHDGSLVGFARVLASTHEHVSPLVWVLVAAAGWAVVDTRRRPSLADADVVRRSSTVAGALMVAGCAVGCTNDFYWACFSPPAPAWTAACTAHELIGTRLALTLLALAVAAFGVHGRTRTRPALVPLSIWLLGRVAGDGLAVIAGHLACGDTYEPAVLEALAYASWTADASLSTIAAALTVHVALRDRLEGVASPRARVGPLVPVLVLITLAAFDAPLTTGFPQSRPEAIWREVSVTPLRSAGEAAQSFLPTRYPNRASFVLTSAGELHMFAAGRHHALAPGEVVVIEGDAEVVFDRDATVGDLRHALPHLRLVSDIALVSLGRPEVGPATRDRWPFVDMASRTLAVRYVRVGEEERIRTCGRETVNAPVFSDLTFDIRAKQAPHGFSPSRDPLGFSIHRPEWPAAAPPRAGEVEPSLGGVFFESRETEWLERDDVPLRDVVAGDAPLAIAIHRALGARDRLVALGTGRERPREERPWALRASSLGIVAGVLRSAVPRGAPRAAAASRTRDRATRRALRREASRSALPAVARRTRRDGRRHRAGWGAVPRGRPDRPDRVVPDAASDPRAGRAPVAPSRCDRRRRLGPRRDPRGRRGRVARRVPAMSERGSPTPAATGTVSRL